MGLMPFASSPAAGTPLLQVRDLAVEFQTIDGSVRAVEGTAVGTVAFGMRSDPSERNRAHVGAERGAVHTMDAASQSPMRCCRASSAPCCEAVTGGSEGRR